jgi:alpha-beta hydrolase superfamily lysophospholipase
MMPAMARDEELSITAGQATLRGTLTLPDTTAAAEEPRWPAALLLPTFLPRDRDGHFDRRRHPAWFLPEPDGRPGLLARVAAELARHGVASLRYDKRGCGTSDGEWATSGLFTLVDDARDAVAVLRGHPAIDPARIGLVGHGEGAWVALSVAGADPAIGPLTLVGAPARGLRDVLRRAAASRARRRTRSGARPDHPFVAAFDRALEELIERAERGEAAMTLAVPGGDHVDIGLGAWEQAFRIPTRALATLQRRSVTLVHGAADTWVDPDEADLLEAALAVTATPARIVIPRADHDLAEADDDHLRAIAADLRARLQPRRLPTVLLSIGLR